MKDKAHGFPHAKTVYNIQQNLLEYGKISLTENENNVLQCATMLHDITMIGSPVEYMKVFADHIDVSKNSLSQLLTGLDGYCSSSVFISAGYFKSALQNPDENLCRFHHLTAALFAYKILQEELGSVDAKIAAWAILFHHESKLDQIPGDPVVRLLRDSVKIHSLDELSLCKNISKYVVNYERPFFNPAIQQKLRIDVLEGRKIPDEQELENSELKLDAFQFALKTLFLDTNPNMFALPEIAGPYLQDHDVFTRLLNRVILSAEQHKKTSESQIENLELLKMLLSHAMKSSNYSSNVEMIAKGLEVVDIHLRMTLDQIETDLKCNPPSIEGLFLKARTLQAMEDLKASNDAYAEAFLQQGLEFIKQRDLEEACYYFELSEKYNPHFFEALRNKAGVLFQLKQYEKAVEYYDKAIDAAIEQNLSKPSIVKVLMVKAYTLLEPLNSPYKSLVAIKEALKLLPEDMIPEDTTVLQNDEEADFLRDEARQIERLAEIKYAMRN